MLEDFGNKFQVSNDLIRCSICRRYVDTKKESVYNLYWSWENKPGPKWVCKKCLGKYGKKDSGRHEKRHERRQTTQPGCDWPT